MSEKKQEYDIKIVIEKDKTEMVELIEKFYLVDCVDETGCINLKKLILALKNDYNMPMQNKEIQFYLADAEIYMNCGLDPINEDIRIRSQNYENNDLITIKARDLGISLVHRLMSFDAGTAASQEKQRTGADQNAEKSKCRRTKERRIGHIIDKVIEWRKYYSGTPGKNERQFSLEEAAKEVAISKKSLDDYLFQVRYGYKYGFNFNEHYNDKVGVLRDFVRQNKKNDKNEIKQKKGMKE